MWRTPSQGEPVDTLGGVTTCVELGEEWQLRVMMKRRRRRRRSSLRNRRKLHGSKGAWKSSEGKMINSRYFISTNKCGRGAHVSNAARKAQIAREKEEAKRNRKNAKVSLLMEHPYLSMHC